MDKLGAGGNETKKKTTVILKGEERSEMSPKAFLVGLTKNSIPKKIKDSVKYKFCFELVTSANTSSSGSEEPADIYRHRNTETHGRQILKISYITSKLGRIESNLPTGKKTLNPKQHRNRS